MATDPSGHDWLDNVANLSGGYGKGLTFGLTGAISQLINRSLGYGEFQYGGGWFTAGEIAGSVHQMALGAPLAKLGIAGIRAIGIARETLPLYEAANLANSQGLSAAGRALAKHPEILGYDSEQALRAVYGNNAELSAAGARTVEQMLAKGSVRSFIQSRSKQMILEYRLPNGSAAAWEKATGKFVGFRN